jgi:DNA-directed RNA polymerase subunit RPC12/RpoP
MDSIDAALRRIEEIGRENFRCPRCHGFIPNDETPGAYPGALSRTTRGEHDTPVYVCSACGADEGMLQFMKGYCQPQSEWPVTRIFHMPTPEDFERLRNADPLAD